MEGQNRQARSRAKNVFTEELVILKSSREFLTREDITLHDCKEELSSLQKSYDDLLDQSKLITKVSDRLQKKINNANAELGVKNVQLQESLDALTKAKVGRRAAAITIFVVIGLFLLTEAFLEPPIERYMNKVFPPDDVTALFTVATFFALLVKGLIALSLRPIEKIVEKRLMKKEAERIEAERRAELNLS